VPWISRVGVDDLRAWLELAAQGPIAGTEVVKRLGPADGPEPTVDYTITNTGRQDQPFLRKSHIAVQLQPDTVVDLAAGEVLMHYVGVPRAGPAGGVFDWPAFESDGV
jgi:hypothetical protein